MKKNLFWIFSIVLFGTIVMTTTSSCGSDDLCNDADCVHGTCFEDACVCDVGYALDASGFCTDCAEGYVKDVDGNCVEECDDADCGDNASCVDNECVCNIGYERDADNNCVLEREKFLGLYGVVDVCGTDTFTYDLVIDELLGSDEGIRLKNLGNFDCQDPNTGAPVDYFVEATVVGASLSFFDFETCGTTFSGDGTLGSGVIILNYTAAYDGNVDDCVATLTKK